MEVDEMRVRLEREAEELSAMEGQGKLCKKILLVIRRYEANASIYLSKHAQNATFLCKHEHNAVSSDAVINTTSAV